MSHAPCPFIHPNGSCSLPVCFTDTRGCAPPTTWVFTDLPVANGVVRVHLPQQALVLYVPPIVVLVDASGRSTHCHVVASWWWSEQQTLFVQVHMPQPTMPPDAGRPGSVAAWSIRPFPLTCVGRDGQYQIHTLRGPLVKAKHKTE
jgi:hypothetical protein